MERFLELAREVRVQGLEAVFQVGPCERSLGQEAAAKGFEVVDTPSWGRMAAQMRRARCVVGNDTGPMHLAAMLGAPTLTLYFHGSEGTWFPYGEDGRAVHVALSPNCSRTRCMESCPEAATCGWAIAFGTVAAVWKTMWGKNEGNRISGGIASPLPTNEPSRSDKEKNNEQW